MGSMLTDNEKKLVTALLKMDEALPHENPLSDDAPKPKWCPILCEVVGHAEGECCGICVELSEVTVQALDDAFGKPNE